MVTGGSSGPPEPDSEHTQLYRQTFRQLAASKVRVVGYVHISYARRPLKQALAAVQQWYDGYGDCLSGIFVDEAACKERANVTLAIGSIATSARAMPSLPATCKHTALVTIHMLVAVCFGTFQNIAMLRLQQIGMYAEHGICLLQTTDESVMYTAALRQAVKSHGDTQLLILNPGVATDARLAQQVGTYGTENLLFPSFHLPLCAVRMRSC